MTSPELSRQNENNERFYCNPLTGRDDYWSVTRVIGNTIPNGLHKVPPHTLANASARGDYIHDQLEQGTIQDRNVRHPVNINGLDEFLEQARAYDNAWRPHVEYAELTVFNDTIGYAGTLDAVMWVQTPLGTLLLLVDYKTSRKISAYVALQLAALRHAEYALLATPNSGNESHKRIDVPTVDGCAVVHITSDGFSIVPIEAGAEQFEMFKQCARVARIPELLGGTIGEPLPTPTVPGNIRRCRLLIDRARSLDDSAKQALRDSLIGDNLALLDVNGNPMDLTHKQLDRVEKHLKLADAQHGDQLTAEQLVERTDLMAKARQLPVDLEADMTQALRDYGWPKTGVRTHHLDFLRKLVTDNVNAQCERSMQSVASMVEALGSEATEDEFKTICTTASFGRTDEPDYLTSLEFERVDALAESLGAGVIVIEGSTLHSTSDALDILVERAGGKAKALELAKHVAVSWQRPIPKSSAKAFVDPLIAAGVFAATSAPVATVAVAAA